MQYRSRCNIFNSFGIALLFRYIYKGRPVKRTREVPSKTIFAGKRTKEKQYGGIMLNTCCKEIWLNVIVTD
jgi:hypothetical protein